jgi:hypothetical protein
MEANYRSNGSGAGLNAAVKLAEFGLFSVYARRITEQADNSGSLYSLPDAQHAEGEFH